MIIDKKFPISQLPDDPAPGTRDAEIAHLAFLVTFTNEQVAYAKMKSIEAYAEYQEHTARRDEALDRLVAMARGVKLPAR